MNTSKRLIRIAVSAALAATMLLPSAMALYPAKVKADALYLRETPGGKIIATLSQDTFVAVLNNSNSWYKIAANGREGYVNGSYLAGTATTDFDLGSARIICDTTVNLREQPNTSSRIISSLSKNATVKVAGVYKGWYKISYNGKTGYVHPDFISFLGVQTPANQGVAKKPVPSSAEATTDVEVSGTRAEVLDYAAQFLGTPYVYGGSTPSGFDCSGFTSYVFKNTVGTIPRVAQSQFDALPRVSREELLPGDLVFFGSSAYSISHVGIYVGNDTFIHSPHTGEVVKYEPLAGNYESRFQGGGRVISD